MVKQTLPQALNFPPIEITFFNTCILYINTKRDLIILLSILLTIELYYTCFEIKTTSASPNSKHIILCINSWSDYITRLDASNIYLYLSSWCVCFLVAFLVLLLPPANMEKACLNCVFQQYSETCLETTAMRDHLSWKTTFSWQKVPHFNIIGPVTKDHAPVLTDHIVWVNRAVFQDSLL